MVGGDATGLRFSIKQVIQVLYNTVAIENHRHIFGRATRQTSLTGETQEQAHHGHYPNMVWVRSVTWLTSKECSDGRSKEDAKTESKEKG